MKNPARNLREIGATAFDLLAFRYPGFVYGAGVGTKSIPVFCFHGVEQIPFEAILEFLQANGYSTLDADEYVSVLSGRTIPPKRSVVMTFDDGWGSLWTIGFPLLKKYDSKIIVFLPPGRIERAQQPYTTHIREGKAGSLVEAPSARDSSAQPLLTWEEISVMHASGLVDFQSHSYSHALICKGPKIVDFVNPEALSSFNILEFPLPTHRRPTGAVPAVRLGEPLYESAPRLSNLPQLIPDASVADACVDFVQQHGGHEFFERSEWRMELDKMANKLIAKSNGWQIESPDEQREAIRFELIASREAIQQMLPGKNVRHLCYPWHVAESIAVEETRAAGYLGCYWGKIGGRYFNRVPGDPTKIARVGSDFFFRLPGKGRIPLARILLRKAVRRASEGSPYITH